MLKLNKMTDYAIVCLGILSKKPNTFVTAHEISQESGISLTAIQKILKLLAKNSNVLLTLQGSLGGYKLAVSPSSISITSVIEMIDGPINHIMC